METGHTQLDIKIFGKTQLPVFGRKLYVAGLIDQGSKFFYSEVLVQQTTVELIEFYKRAYVYFEEHGITIKRTRTDNAMQFKETNFVRSPQFYDLLKSLKVEHQFTPLGVSQANGQIENIFGKYDKELLPGIWDVAEMKVFEEKVKQYVEYHNFYRYHTNSINKYDDRFPKYIIPINFLKGLNEIDFKGEIYLPPVHGHIEHLSSEIDYGSKE
ncbi:DDE-type integrase/transposase/recombinase [[Mycoplasma] testudinis]|uniref:DDE-type integrase/transposase/recombinase n=1 Tax=[Mycoplasma] testudinis TaxID=33924 RepID=UPI0004878E90|nr:DDE-type integrase/transposase/recombinase [[Mycoplasma] testudinis]